jgi:hypothetical protein
VVNKTPPPRPNFPQKTTTLGLMRRNDNSHTTMNPNNGHHNLLVIYIMLSKSSTFRPIPLLLIG